MHKYLILPVFVTCILLSLAKKDACAEGRRATVWNGVYSKIQALRGRRIYDQSCAQCHGALLNGTSEAPPLAGEEFLSNFNGLTVGNLIDRTRKTMPLNEPGSLNRSQYADVTAFMLEMNGFPAGKVNLDPESDRLKEILLTMRP